MRKRGWTERDRWEDVQTPRADLAEFDLIEPKLRAAAFSQFDPHSFLGARNQAILALLSDCGVRRDELCIIKDADVNLTDMQVRVYAPKTRQTRWRLVPFSEQTATVLTHYVRLRQRYLARRSRKRARAGDDGQRIVTERRLEMDCFLISQSGEQLQGDSMASLLKRMRVRLRRQGFKEAQLHARPFRHDYITRKALDGENPSILKRWIGHRTFAMTDRYFGIAESKLAAVRPKHSVLEGIVPLPQKRRGRPGKGTEPVRTPKSEIMDCGPRAVSLQRQSAKP
jgi:site-specific recombinase XerD